MKYKNIRISTEDGARVDALHEQTGVSRCKLMSKAIDALLEKMAKEKAQQVQS